MASHIIVLTFSLDFALHIKEGQGKGQMLLSLKVLLLFQNLREARILLISNEIEMS